ncbi:hypothetical protein DSO57_1005780 [Entomophthora muscae]|uniref:Uncharacterized protein n=1 Tax=Entomophthora muscae TaxID=34485 RepID=A0ACC2SWT3_9FUNG|nr:hypothetical protein DSO57_1005780 [Entomophthora muscae]
MSGMFLTRSQDVFIDVKNCEREFDKITKFGSHPGRKIHWDAIQWVAAMAALSRVHNENVRERCERKELSPIRAIPDSSQWLKS